MATDPGEGALAHRFADAFGRPPEAVWAAPGRVNLIGEHTDYSGGFVLPVAIDRRATVAVAGRDDGLLRAISEQSDDGPVEVPLSGLAPGSVPGWAAYVAGMAWALAERGIPVAGADVLLDGRVPLGAGLSSSAAIECATGAALAGLAGADLAGMPLALAAQHAENDFVGAPVGIMDQAASVLCTAGHALLLDVDSLETRQVPFDPAAHGLELLVIDTGVRHSHAGGAYGDRRRAVEEGTRLLGVRALREVRDPETGLTDPVLHRRVRHVVSENARVLAAVEALESGDLRAFGARMTESHASLRDDFEVSCAELDVAVEAALGAGALGARMTGGGFGGCAVALVPAGTSGAVTGAVGRAYAERGFTAATVWPCTPGPGLTRLG